MAPEAFLTNRAGAHSGERTRFRSASRSGWVCKEEMGVFHQSDFDQCTIEQVIQAGKRELVVLDDVFTNTDEDRLKRIFGILNEMREHAQFLILTCHPERYSSLKDVKRN